MVGKEKKRRGGSEGHAERLRRERKGQLPPRGEPLRVALTAGRSELGGRQISSASMANGVDQDLGSKRLHSR